jgi:hypothetical protein
VAARQQGADWSMAYYMHDWQLPNVATVLCPIFDVISVHARLGSIVTHLMVSLRQRRTSGPAVLVRLAVMHSSALPGSLLPGNVKGCGMSLLQGPGD